MSFEGDGQSPAQDERLGEQLGGGSLRDAVQHKGVVELGSESDTSLSEHDSDNSDNSGSDPSDGDAESSELGMSDESIAKNPPSPDQDRGDDLDEDDLEPHLNYESYEEPPQRDLNENPTDLFGLAAHALAAQQELENQPHGPLGVSNGASAQGPSLTTDLRDTEPFASEQSAAFESLDESRDSSALAWAAQQPKSANFQAQEEIRQEPEVEEPDSSNALTIEEISSVQRLPTSRTNDLGLSASGLNVENAREEARAEARTRIRALEAEVQRLEATEWDLRRRLNDAALQTEAVRAERERTTVSAAVHETELQRLRSSLNQIRIQQEARVIELTASADDHKIELEAERRAHDVLRQRFTEQSGALAEARAAVAELERARIGLESQTSSARRAEQRTQQQLAELRDELETTLAELASARAELTLQTQTLAEVHAQARADALAEFAPEAVNDESMWRERYIELRRQMDAVATEFERREPEILALQREHAEAEARAAQAQDDASQAQSEKSALGRKLRAADRRASDLLVEQQLTEQLVDDLRRQLLQLLTDKMLSTSGDTPMSREDEEELAKLREKVALDSVTEGSEIDGQALISERLLLFRDVAELQFQNEALLKACRGLAKQLDPDGDAVASAASAASQRSSADELREAGDALEDLRSRFVAVQTELEEMRHSASQSQEAIKTRDVELTVLRSQAAAAEKQVADLRRRLALPEPAAAQLPSDDISIVRHELETERARLIDLKRQLDTNRDEVSALTKRVAAGQIALERAQQKTLAAESDAADARAEADRTQLSLSALRSEKQLWLEREQRLMSQVSTAQAEAEAYAHKTGISESRRSELESKLISTMERLETLVASSGGDARHAELEEQVAASAGRIAEKEAQIQTLETQLTQRQSESTQLHSRLETLEMNLTAAETRASKLVEDINAAQARYTAEKAQFQKRDDDLVEQVNNLEDSLTEVREKLRLTQEDQLTERSASGNVQKELSDTQEALDATRKNLEAAQKELESQRQIQADLHAKLEAAQSQHGEALIEGEASLRRDLEAALRNELSNSLRSEVETELRPELEKTIRADLEATLRPALEASLREDSKTNNLHESLSGESSSQTVEALRSEIEAEVRSKIANEQPKISDVPDDPGQLFDALIKYVPREEVERFQRVILSTEQERVKPAFRKRLDAVRDAAESDMRAKIVEAEQRAEEKATKRAEMRTKLQTQKLSKLETKNKELADQVEELRNKVRRLKGGALDDEPRDPSSLPSQPSFQPPQQQTQPITQSSPSVAYGDYQPLAFGTPFQPTRSTTAGFDQPQKRQSQETFPEIENQKRRKEGDNHHVDQSEIS